MKDLKVISPNGDVINVTERAFELVYSHQGYRVYTEPKEEVQEPTVQPEQEPEAKEEKKNSRKVKKVEE